MLVKLKHVNRARGRNGRVYYYHRPTGQRLPGEPGSVEFVTRLEELNRQIAAPATRDAPLPGTLADAIARYKAAPEFTQRDDRTRKDYGHYLDTLRRGWGDLPLERFDRALILEIRDGFADKPRTANYLIQVARRLFNFAIDRSMPGVTVNPAARPGRLRTTGGPHKPWPVGAIKAFLKVAPAPMRIAMVLAICTGQRQGDILRMPWSAFDGTAVEIVQAKTGNRVWLPASALLRALLKGLARPKDGKLASVTILTTAAGKPFKGDHFKHEWRKVTLAAGLDGYTFHGLRHTAGQAVADLGGTEDEIMSLLGHDSREATQIYVRRSARQARGAVAKIERFEKRFAKQALQNTPGKNC